MHASSFERNCRDYIAQDKKNRMERRLPIEQKEIRVYVVLLLLITD
jgi:hypothetical protein